jgi:hypothetical protein
LPLALANFQDIFQINFLSIAVGFSQSFEIFLIYFCHQLPLASANLSKYFSDISTFNCRWLQPIFLDISNIFLPSIAVGFSQSF